MSVRTGVEGALRDHHVGFLDQGIVDHVDDSVGALDVGTEHGDPAIPPEDLVFCKGEIFFRNVELVGGRHTLK